MFRFRRSHPVAAHSEAGLAEPTPDIADAVMRRRLNRSLPVALVAALCATALYVNISGNTVFKPTTSVSAPPLIPDAPPLPSLTLSDAEIGRASCRERVYCVV